MPDIYFDVDTALAEVPVNIFPLTDDTDMKTRETAVAYNAAGMDLVWNFVTSAGAFTQTAVTPTTAGTYDWTHQGDGMYTIEIPASAGASINNDTEGYGWFTGVATGVMPWRSPIFGFRAAAINDALCDGGDLLDVSVTQFGGTNGTFSAGRPEVNTSHIAGTSQTARDLGASVLLSSGTGTGQVSLTSGRVAADVTYWNGAVLTGKTGAFPEFGIVDSGTAQSATGTTLVLRSAAAFADDELIGATILIVSATAGAGQRRIITDYVGATDTATVDTWTTTPSGTIVYAIFGSPPASSGLPVPANMTQIGGDAQSATDLKDFADAGYDPATNKVQGVVLTDTATNLTNAPGAGDFTATMKTSIGTAVAASAVASVTGNVGGNVTGSVGSVATGGITAASIATGAIDADAIAADAVTEIQNGLATAAALATVDGIVDTLVSGVITGAAATGTLSTTQATSNLTGYADDQLIGRVIIWLTGNCEGEATDITDYASASGLLTFTALTTAPGNGDTFKIV